MSKRTAPEVNAGSMADIAFLLLIFFLVTTTIDKDEGLLRQLPRDEPNPTEILLHERNVLEIKIGQEGDLLVEDEVIAISNLQAIVVAFIDNGGAKLGEEGYCEYCSGLRDALSSDSPQEAVISVSSHREAPYENYIAVQNELSAAYNTLRNKASQKIFNYDYTSTKRALDNGLLKTDILKTKEELKLIRDLYPMLISEAEIKAVY
jgi:biopolymer transport protein ExbD